MNKINKKIGEHLKKKLAPIKEEDEYKVEES